MRVLNLGRFSEKTMKESEKIKRKVFKHFSFYNFNAIACIESTRYQDAGAYTDMPKNQAGGQCESAQSSKKTEVQLNETQVINQ